MDGTKTTSVDIYTSETIWLEDGTYAGHSTSESIWLEEPFDVDVSKMADEQHMVFGWANVSVNKDGTIPIDWDGDVIPPQVMEKAAYQYVLKYRTSGEMHQGEAVGYMIESCMFTKQKMAAMGLTEGSVPEGWWIGFYIPDDAVVAKVKSGEYKMFSIQGKAKKIKL